MKKSLFIYVIAMLLVLTTLAGCSSGSSSNDSKDVWELYEGAYSDVNGSLAAIDDLGRKVSMESSGNPERVVGLFYFLWLDDGLAKGIYDNTKILAKDPDAPKSRAAWALAGGNSDVGSLHWWSEPLLGYYSSYDAWVMHKHVQMFIQADIDYLMIDVTNGPIYKEQSLLLFSILDTYYQQGWDVPQVGFYAHTDTAKTINTIYYQIYKQHPEYSHLWFCYDGKPMIVGDIENVTLSKDIREFFTVKQSYMSSYEVSYLDENGTRIYDYNMLPEMFPWIDFSPWPTELKNPKGEVWSMTISVAEVVGALSSDSYLYKTNARSRNFDGSTNRHWNEGEADAWKYGYNFQRQIDYALEKDPPMIFITGWNEWIAGNWESDMWMKDYRDSYLPKNYSGVTFVDNFDINNSRDIEPMKGGYGDNYFMQMVEFIRRYKGTDARVNVGANTTVDVKGDWSQWNSVTAVYQDQTGETGARDTGVYAQYSLVDANNYVSAAAANDIATMKVARDHEHFYFYVDCVEDIDVSKDTHMVLFIKSGLEAASAWNGYDYLVESHSGSLKRCGRDGIWEAVSSVELRLEGNQLMLKVSAASLGYASTDLVDLQFKWADSWVSDNGLWSFYTDGECAPYGRFNYVFSNRR